MSVVHVEKRERWTPIANATLEDKRLSYKARGLLAYLLSKPDDWTVRIEELAAASDPDGVDAVRTGLDELQQHGYATFQRARRERGRFVAGGWTVRERPHEDFPYVENPYMGKPYVEKPHMDLPYVDSPYMENPTLVITEKKVMTDLPKTETPPLSPSQGEEVKRQPKPVKRYMPDDEREQYRLKDTIIDLPFAAWKDKRYPEADTEAQWEYFVSQCLAKGYLYANFRQAFMNSFAWENSPAQRPARASPSRLLDRLSDRERMTAEATMRILQRDEDGEDRQESVSHRAQQNGQLLR